VSAGPFTEREQRAWDLIGEAFEAVMELDERGRLATNVAEMSMATHTLQSAVVQHMNHRVWPDAFSDWWEYRGLGAELDTLAES